MDPEGMMLGERGSAENGKFADIFIHRVSSTGREGDSRKVVCYQGTWGAAVQRTQNFSETGGIKWAISGCLS